MIHHDQAHHRKENAREQVDEKAAPVAARDGIHQLNHPTQQEHRAKKDCRCQRGDERADHRGYSDEHEKDPKDEQQQPRFPKVLQLLAQWVVGHQIGICAHEILSCFEEMVSEIIFNLQKPGKIGKHALEPVIDLCAAVRAS